MYEKVYLYDFKKVYLYEKVYLYAKKVYCTELEAATIPEPATGTVYCWKIELIYVDIMSS